MILVVDNYDSFAYNLVQYIGEFADVTVRRNDEIDVDTIHALDPDGIVVSPGPGTPADAGVSVDVFAETDHPALGVCLGHQALCAASGAPVVHAPDVVHGKPSTVHHDGVGLYEGLPNPLTVGRYHSLAVERASLPDTLTETAHTVAGRGPSHSADAGDPDAGVVMGVRHVDRPHVGLQFHPESVLTDAGKQIVENFCTDVAQG